MHFQPRRDKGTESAQEKVPQISDSNMDPRASLCRKLHQDLNHLREPTSQVAAGSQELLALVQEPLTRTDPISTRAAAGTICSHRARFKTFSISIEVTRWLEEFVQRQQAYPCAAKRRRRDC